MSFEYLIPTLGGIGLLVFDVILMQVPYKTEEIARTKHWLLHNYQVYFLHIWTMVM